MAKVKKPISDAEVANVLKEYYYKIENPASFGGILKLSKATGIPTERIKKWLMTQDVYTLHKPVRYKFNRRKVLAYGINELIQCDLVDLTKFSKYNKGIKFLLTAIDVFSKYAFAIPLRNKSAESVSNGLKILLKQLKPSPQLFQSDFGREFYNSKVQALFKKHNIHHYSTHSEYKASVVERFNRTLKSKLYRIFTHRNSYKYYDVLKHVLRSYNSTKHRSLGVAPNEVTPELESHIFQKLYGYRTESKFKFNINDQVRISKARKVFQRGYLPNWTDEIFIVHKRFATNPPTYVLKDLKDEILKGRFYEEELQRVVKSASDYWRVEKILKTRGSGPDQEFYVKWLGYDNRHNSWIKKRWIKS